MPKGSGIYRGQIPATPDYVQAVSLSSGVGQAFDIPAGMGYVGFSMNADFWAKYGSTAALVPSTSTTAGSSTPELNPTIRDFGSSLGCTGISLVSDFACKGSLSWYSKAY